MDTQGHGTAISGVIGAIGDNGVGLAGVNWAVQMMPVRMQASGSDRDIANAVAGLDYAVDKEATISSNSWGDNTYSQAMYDAINGARISGHLFVAAAHNQAEDNDFVPVYPASYDLDNIISVAATDDTDTLASFSNFGSISVDLSAPSPDIQTTDLGNSYKLGGGTSAATPHVSGVAALLRSLHPTWSTAQIKAQILDTVDPLPSLAGKTVSGGRVNAAAAVLPTSIHVNHPTIIEGNTGTTNLVFTVSRRGDSSGTVTLDWSTADDTATAGTDYVAASSTVQFLASETSKTITVLVSGETNDESDETMFVDLALVSGAATVVDARAQGSILNDDVPISITDVTVTEGDDSPHYRGMFVDFPAGVNFWNVTFGPDGLLYTSYNGGSNSIVRHNGTTGEFVDRFIGRNILSGVRDIRFRDGFLYVGSEYSDEVFRFDATSGAFVDVFVTAGSGGIDGPHGLTFGPDSNGDSVPELYVTGRNSANVVRYDGVTGQPLGTYITSGAGGLSLPEGLTFDPTESFLFVASGGSSEVLKYDALTGASVGIGAGSPVSSPKDVKFGSDGLMYVASAGNDRILRFTSGGSFVDDFVPAGAGGMDDPSRVAFGPDGNLYVSGSGIEGIMRFGAETEAVFSVSLAAPSSLTVSVDFSTADGTAKVLDGDYSAVSGTVTFIAGLTTQTILVPTLDDGVEESTESFFVNLLGSTGAAIQDSQGEATIIDDGDPANQPPLAGDDAYSVAEDISLNVAAPGVLTDDTDPESDSLTAVLVTGAGSGFVTLNADGSFVYTPNADFNGSDSFTYKANDGTSDSNVATVSITVTPVNDIPVANAQSLATDEDTSLAITLTGSDVDGDPLTYSVVSGPTNGSLSGTAPNLTYTPNAEYNGSDSLSFVGNDGTVDSAVATVSITVNPVNDSPTISDISDQTIDEDTATGAIAFTIGDLETPADSLTLSGSSANTTLVPNGNIVFGGSGANRTVIVTPMPDQSGTATVTVTVSDGADIGQDSFVLTVTSVNDAPVADDQSIPAKENTPKSITLTASDLEGDPLTYSVVVGPINGTLSGTAPDLTYTPNTGYTGSDSFTFKANDGTLDSNVATVSITVAANNPPVADAQGVSLAEDTSLPITLTGSDPDGDPITYSVVSGPTQGSLSGPAPNVTYTPGANFNGADSFTFIVNDGTDDSAVATVSITVTPVNDAPVADAQAVATDEDTAVSIILTGSDIDGDALTYSVVSGPANGSLSGTAPSLTYTPGADFNGSDSFTFKVNDGSVDSNIAMVSITVNPVNDAPVAAADSYSLDQDTTSSVVAPGVLANDNDPDGDALTSAVVSTTSNGSLTLNSDGSFDYTPDTGYVGADSFTYQAHDGTVAGNVATVSLTVNAVSTGPNLAHGVVNGVGSSGWTAVSLADSYSSMVVLASANYDNSSAPGVVRIRNAIGNSFDVRVDAAGGAALSGVNVHYMVVEEGVYDEADYRLEAVKYVSTVTDEKNSWAGESRSYQQPYSAPVVFGQVMTYNDADWSVFWAAGSSRQSPPSSTALKVGKHVGEDSDNTRANETVGYLVIETNTSGTAEIEGLPYVAALGGDSIKGVGDSPSYNYSYTAMANSKTAVVSQAAMDGGNGGWAVLYGSDPITPTGNTLKLAIDEDQSKDTERRHTTEQVAYFIIDPPLQQGAEAHAAIKMEVLPLDALLLTDSNETSVARSHGRAVTSNEFPELLRPHEERQSLPGDLVSQAAASTRRAAIRLQALDEFFAHRSDEGLVDEDLLSELL